MLTRIFSQFSLTLGVCLIAFAMANLCFSSETENGNENCSGSCDFIANQCTSDSTSTNQCTGTGCACRGNTQVLCGCKKKYSPFG